MSQRARLILLVVGVIALFTVVGLIARAGGAFDFTRDHANTRTNPWGTKAWRELLERTGVATATWDKPLTELSGEVTFLVVLDPVKPIQVEERQALVEWVEGGGRLVIAPFAYRATALTGGWAAHSMDETLACFGLRAFGGNDAEVAVQRRADTPLTADVSTVFVPTDQRLRALSSGDEDEVPGGHRVLLGDDQGAAAMELRLGEGRVVALCEAEILANATLREADNVVLAANLAFAGGAPAMAYFDEYHHAISLDEGVFAGPQVDASPFRYTIFALLAVAAVYAVGRARRFGAPLPPQEDSRRAGVEFVQAFAQVYARADAAAAAARLLGGGFRRKLARAAGVPASVRRPVLVTALHRRRLPGEEMVALLTRLEQPGEVSDGTLLEMAQEAARYERML